jgi:hypothetical protein
MKGISALWVPLVVLLYSIEEPRSVALWVGLLACGLVVALALAWRGWPSWVVWVVRCVFVIFTALFLLAHQFFLIGIVAVVLGLVVAAFINSRNLEDQRARAAWRKTQ